MNWQIILASLKARPVRTAVSILAVTLEVIMILVVVGLTAGISSETARRIEGVGADIMMQSPNSSIILALTSSPMPEAFSAKILEIEGVKAVAPILTMVNSQGNGLEIVYGIDPASFDAVTGGFNYLKGNLFSADNDILVDDWYAKAKRVDVGNEIELLNHKFRISGIVENGKGSRLFMSLKAAQDMNGAAGKASIFYIKLNRRDDIGIVTERMAKVFTGYTLRDMREIASLMTSNNIPGLDLFIRAVVFISVCVGIMVIFLSMYTTITERTREIGILRSMGASKGFIVWLILQESFFVCLVGVVIGTAASFVLAQTIHALFQTLIVLITPDWVVKAALSAVLSGVIGALYPSVKAATKDPVEALAYE